MVGLAEALPVASAWQPLERLPEVINILTEPSGPKGVLLQGTGSWVEREFENQKLVGEDLAEMDYQPGHLCAYPYRVVIVRKNISVQKGERGVLEEVRYFFYITNRTRTKRLKKIVGLANGRCDQENVIEQLKNGVNAMRVPVNNLESNWGYMVMAALAWNLKAWYGCGAESEPGLELVKMEFRRFLHAISSCPPDCAHSHAGSFIGCWDITVGLKTSSRAGSICVGSDAT